MKLLLASILAGALAVSVASAAGLTEVWRASGFDLPESVSWDAKAKAFYVSNLGTDPVSKDGNGFISRLGPDGTVDVLKWVTGLDAPKGTEVVGDRLFVTDIDRLVEIDTVKGKIVKTYPVPGAKFLNDLAVAADGRIFISDTYGDAIFVFQNGAVSEWLRSSQLAGPNGLTIIGKRLIVANLGDLSGAKPKPSNVKAVDLETKAITNFGTADPVGHLDGIEKDGAGGVFVTDNPGGRLLDIMPGKPAIEVAKLKPGAADLEYVPDGKLFVIPQMQQSEIVAYRN
jgi:DNA-binding beta-propeller fold protein YncE